MDGSRASGGEGCLTDVARLARGKQHRRNGGWFRDIGYLHFSRPRAV